MTDTTQHDIETRLADVEPDVEVLLVERVGASTMRLVIDRPDGVDLGTCERVTNHLRDLLLDVGLEVSSPGPERPLTKPDHFRRFLGRRARVRTRAPRDGRRSFTGELLGASDAGGDGRRGRRGRRVDPLLADRPQQPGGRHEGGRLMRLCTTADRRGG